MIRRAFLVLFWHKDHKDIGTRNWYKETGHALSLQNKPYPLRLCLFCPLRLSFLKRMSSLDLFFE